MPLAIDIFALIVPKKVIETKYAGGIAQFKKDFFRGTDADMEDGELLGVGYMDADDVDVEKLMKRGLSFNRSEPFSEDFVIVSRYGDPLLWPCKWLIQNSLHAWHVEASEENKKRAEEVGDMTIERVFELMDMDQNPLASFWL
jgi:hypothetical protein